MLDLDFYFNVGSASLRFSAFYFYFGFYGLFYFYTFFYKTFPYFYF